MESFNPHKVLIKSSGASVEAFIDNVKIKRLLAYKVEQIFPGVAKVNIEFWADAEIQIDENAEKEPQCLNQ